MHGTTQALNTMASIVARDGLHTGEQMATLGPPIRLDISALAYLVTEGRVPDVFFTDEVASIDLIESSELAMAVIRAISESLDSEPCETGGRPDLIEHVFSWTATNPIGERFPPSTDEVIGRLLRAADHATQTATGSAA